MLSKIIHISNQVQDSIVVRDDATWRLLCGYLRDTPKAEIENKRSAGVKLCPYSLSLLSPVPILPFSSLPFLPSLFLLTLCMLFPVWRSPPQ